MSKKKKSVKKKRVEKKNSPQQQLSIPELDMDELKHINGGNSNKKEETSVSHPTARNSQIVD
jgi:hypothetical protein